MNEDSKTITGRLNIVSTPIGNYDDITIRAVNTLKASDIVVCEDAKVAARILHHYNISKELLILNEQNEESESEELISLMKKGKDISLISDCGTPVFADPGQTLVNMALQLEIPIYVIPGVTSIMTALVRSGFSIEQFLYAGFLSRKNDERNQQLKDLAYEKQTTIILDTPYRLMPLLEAAAKIMPDRNAYLGCNLTMPFETHHYGTLSEIYVKFKDFHFKGEYVLVLDKYIKRFKFTKELELEETQSFDDSQDSEVKDSENNNEENNNKSIKESSPSDNSEIKKTIPKKIIRRKNPDSNSDSEGSGRRFSDDKPRGESSGRRRFSDDKPRGESSGRRRFSDDKPRGESSGRRRFSDDKPRGEGSGRRRFSDDKPRGEGSDRRRFSDDKPRGEGSDRKRFSDDKPRGEGSDRRRFSDDKPRGEGSDRRRFSDDKPRGEGSSRKKYSDDKPRSEGSDRRRFSDDKPRSEGSNRRRFSDDKPRGEGSSRKRFSDDKPRSEGSTRKRFSDDKPRNEGSDRKRFSDDKPKKEGNRDKSNLLRDKYGKFKKR